MNKVSHFISSLCLSVFCMAPAALLADDTEIYFSRSASSGSDSTSIMFMFDTSGSMLNYDGLSQPRINRLKQGMIDVVNSSPNVQMGIGAFNGTNVGGSIQVPPVGVGEDVCVNAGCSAVRLQATIKVDEDDAEENQLGVVELYDTTLEMQTTGGASSSTGNFELEDQDDDAMQLADGTLDIYSVELEYFYDASSSPAVVGLRFDHINIPVGSTIVSAYITQTVPAGSAFGDQAAIIKIDATTDSPEFSNTSGEQVTDRPTLSATVPWPDIPRKDYDYETFDTPDLASLIQARMDMSDWEYNHALTFIFESSGVFPSDATNRRTTKSKDSWTPASLHIEYTDAAVASNKVGLRFADLNIPRGATINHAAIGFINTENGSVTSNYTISAQAVGDAPVFDTSALNISSRVRTSSVAWSPQTWQAENRPLQTSDIGTVVQEVTDRSDWCGGNSMALIIEGPGSRNVHSRESQKWDAAVLRVSYDPATVDFSTTCISNRVNARIKNSVDDVVEDVTTGLIQSADDLLSTHNGASRNIIGLRFQDVSVPQGATVTSAYLQAVSGGFVTGDVDLTIRGEKAPFSSVTDATIAGSVGGRPKTTATVTWSGVEEKGAGAGLTSVDIDSIIDEIVTQPSWSSGNAISLFMEASVSSSGERAFSSKDDDAPMTLIINYQLEGTVMAGVPHTLRYGGEDLVDTMYNFRAKGGTPLVDAYFEAASYMIGLPVHYGKQRGNQWDEESFFRVSSPGTYTGGTVFRPPLCLDFDLDNVACRLEEVTGTPVYTPPTPGACQNNQIVLLSDGEATQNQSQSIIPSTTSDTSCASRTNDREDCGLELGSWLSATDHFTAIAGDQPIITHTVGFSFSSDFLRELAVVGQGGFYTANSSSELVKVFTNIVKNAADISTSFVAPAASASQTSRLTNGDDLYFAMFRPATKEKWDGNLKKYKFAKSKITPTETVIVDDEGDHAYDSTTGAIGATTRSIWSTAIDGADVAKGGAASKLGLTRNLQTYLPATAGGYTGLVDFDETNTAITNDVLGIGTADAAYRTELLKWARGVDVKDYDNDGDTTEVRAQMGDPMHSPTAIIDYASKSLIFVGTNEGFLHAIDTSDGTEAFAFTPYELLSNLDTFFVDEQTTEHTYGLDGEITTLINDANKNRKVDTGETAYIVVGMRRGGRNYYALNVSDPDNISLAWVIRGGTGDFAELGQTWSKPIRTKVKVAGTPKNVLIFAGGYDVVSDTRVQRDYNDTMGRGFFIVDEANGSLLAKKTITDFSSMTYSIPSTMRVIDINLDGFADYMFVGDMGGQVWRFDIDNNSTDPLATAITGGVVADLGGADPGNNRHFFYEPDVSLLADESGLDYLSVAIGSGWRSHPVDDAVDDRFYVFRDYSVFGPPPKDVSNVIQYPTVLETQLFNATTSSGEADTSGKILKGWYIDLVTGGEKSLSKAVTVNEQVLFTTYLPSAATTGACGVAVGSGRAYAMDIRYGKPVADLDPGTDPDEALDLNDRFVSLLTPGIPPGVSALIPEISPDSPVLLVGPEVLPALNFGDLFKRTFWAEH